MAFTPTTSSVDPKSLWTHNLYEQLIADVQAYLGAIDVSADCDAPISLSKSHQHLSGGRNAINYFKNYFGPKDGSGDPLTDQQVKCVGGFGAVGAGAAEDATEIMAAINDLPATGGVVILPPGTYNTGNVPINLAGTDNTRSNVTLTGFGDSTVIKVGDNWDSSNPPIYFGASSSTGMVLANLMIDGNSAEQSTAHALVDFDTASESMIDNVYFYDSKGDGADLGTGEENSIIGCRFEAIDNTGITGTATEPNFIDSILIRNCKIEDCIYGIVGSGWRGCTIARNKIRGARTYGIHLYSVQNTASIKALSIVGNVITECGFGLLFEQKTS